VLTQTSPLALADAICESLAPPEAAAPLLAFFIAGAFGPAAELLPLCDACAIPGTLLLAGAAAGADMEALFAAGAGALLDAGADMEALFAAGAGALLDAGADIALLLLEAAAGAEEAAAAGCASAVADFLLLLDLPVDAVDDSPVLAPAADSSAAAFLLDLDFFALVLSVELASAAAASLLLDFFDDLDEVLASAESAPEALLLLLDFVDDPVSEADELSALLDFLDDDFLVDEDELSPCAAESSELFFFFDFDVLLPVPLD
jgi:hypothetical protein